MPDLIQIPKPELGRPNDSRLTQAYLDARPELKGLTPFNPGTDFDLIDAINDRLGQLHALVQYADADLYGAVTAARDSAVQAAQDAQDNIVAVNAEWADTKSDIAQDRDAMLAVGNSTPYSTVAAFPDPAARSGKGAVALDTGAVYLSDGVNWGEPIGVVFLKSFANTLAARVAALETGQATGILGYATLALLTADLAHAAGSIAVVTNDATAANNGEYRKVGASGAGSWQQASTSRITAAETKINSNTSILSTYGTITPASALLGQTGATSISGQSGYNGYGSPSITTGSVRSGVRRTTTRMKPASAPTILKKLYRSGGPTGTLVATVPADTLPAANVQTDVAFTSASVIPDFDWEQIVSDAKLQMHIVAGGAPYATPNWQIMTNTDPNAPTWINGGGQAVWYTLYYSLDDSNPILILAAKFKTAYRADLAAEITAALRADTTQAQMVVREFSRTETWSNIKATDAIGGLNNSGGANYYGYGSYIGKPPVADYFEVDVAFDWAAIQPTRGRLWAYRGDPRNGNLLADVTQLVFPPTGARQGERLPYRFYLPSRLNNAALDDIFTTYRFDAPVQAFTTGGAQSAPPYGAIITTADITATPAYSAAVPASPGFVLSCRAGTIDATKPLPDLVPRLIDQARLEKPRLVLTDTLYGVVGREFRVYSRNILIAGLRHTAYSWRYALTGNAGEQRSDGLYWTPAAPGTYNLTVDVLAGDELLARKKVTVVVTAADGPNVTLNLLQKGDSLTAQGYWQGEFNRLSSLQVTAGSQFKVVLQGTQEGSLVNPGDATKKYGIDSTGAYQYIKHEGYSGRDILWHYSNPASPFTFNAAGAPAAADSTIYDFGRYLAANPTVTIGANDWIGTSLMTNDVFSMTRDVQDGTNVEKALDVRMAALETMIASDLAARPTARIAVYTVIPSADSQEAFGKVNGTQITSDRHARTIALANERIIKQFSGRTAGRIYVIPVHQAVDTRRGFPTETYQVSGRVPTQETRIADNLHPKDAGGSWQQADALWAALKAFG